MANGVTEWAPLGWGRKLPVLDPIVSASLPVRLLGMKMRNN